MIQTIPCPVCGVSAAVPFFDGGEAPLATLGWPKSRQEACSMERYRLDFVQCVACGHVWNKAFKYSDIPYKEQPNRMFNTGTLWSGHLSNLADEVVSILPEEPTVIEIGCGSGHFLKALSVRREGRYIGFDPNGSLSHEESTFEFMHRLFYPERDIGLFRPDMLVMRHVLEHFEQPYGFLMQVAWATTVLSLNVRLFVEVPCIDRVFRTGRVSDFFYEHPQQFSSGSLRELLSRVGEVEKLWHAYDGEVVMGVVLLKLSDMWVRRYERAVEFLELSKVAKETIRGQLEELRKGKKNVVIWGGTGKGAAFMNYYGVNDVSFPLVVDSDMEKVGTYVAGCGQKILFRDELKKEPPDVVIIPSHWRARDILKEMEQEGISAGQVLIEHEGRLIDYQRDNHPYSLP